MYHKFLNSRLSIFNRGLVIMITLFVLASLTVSTVFAFNTVFSSPSAALTPGKSWTSISYSFASDNSYAIAKKSNKQLKLSNFNIPGIPGGSTIDGIEVTVEGFTAGLQANVALSYNSGTTYTSTLTTALTGIEAVNTLGGPTNTWGRTWTAGDFTNNKFVMKLTTTGTTGNGITISVDQVQVKVYYTAPSSTLSLSPVSGPYAGTTSMTATLTLTADGTPIPSKTINFYIGGTGIDTSGNCTGTLVGSTATQPGTGVATLASASLAGISAGNYPYGACASFAGDATYQATSITSSLSVIGTGTTLTASPATGAYGGTVDLSATLSLTSDGSPINGEFIDFYLFGNLLGSTKTSNSGVATFSNVNLSEYNAGASNDIRVVFTGNANLNPADSNALITIGQRPITVTAANNTKVYDGTTDSAAVPSITSGSLVTGDTANFSQTYDDKDVGTGKTLTPAGAVNDDNSGQNYNVTFVPVTTGVINKTLSTVTANNQSKWFGEADPVFTFNYSGLMTGETGAVIDVVPTCTVSVPHTAIGTYPIICSGGSDNNYSFSYVNGTLTVGNTSVYIGGTLIGNYGVPAGNTIANRYGINGGPVHVSSITNVFASQRAIFGSSFNSIVGYPANKLTTDYWFTSYDDVGMITYLVIGNPSTNQTAQVDVYIGGVKKNTVPYSIAPGQRIFPRYGINAGPVHVVSTNGVNIFASERTKFQQSFNEVMGYPGNQLTTEYWFTSYDDVGMTTFLVIGNPHASQTAQVDVYIGGVKKNNTPIQIAPGQRVFPRYGINSGPVRVVSTNGVNIFSSERTKFGDTFNEVLGFPGNQVSSEFWFTSYDDTSMITYLIVGNPSTSQTANVDVYIGGVKQNASTIQIAPGQRYFARYGINNGPVHVVSTNGVNVFASERSKYLQSFNEILGLADTQLTTDYWFTSYDDFGMQTQLVIAAP